MLNPMRIQKLVWAFVFVSSTLLFAPSLHAAKARNIILMVSDGTGYNCFEAASYYQYGRAGQQPYDEPGWVRYACRTSPLNRSDNPTGTEEQDKAIVYNTEKAWDKAKEPVVDPNSKPAGTGPFKGYNFLKTTYTDSAAAASALASGVKTYNGSIGYANGPEPEGQSLIRRTIAEIAKTRGLSTGVITSVPWSHATPAGIGGVHNAHRDRYDAIANEMLNSKHLDLMMGAGHPEFDDNGAPREPKKRSDYNYVGGLETWEKLKDGTHPGGWTLVQTKAEFEALMHGLTPKKVVGTAQVASTLQQGRQTRDWDGDTYVDAADRRSAPAYGDPLNPTVPTLPTMAKAALNILNNRGTGFFLMIEGGAVDWANHANQPGRMIEEACDFLAALRAVNDWVNTYSSWDETLVIVTADHETGLLWGPNSDTVAFDKVVNNGAGKMPGLHYNATSHSASLVPLFAKGPGSELFESMIVAYDPVRGAYVDNTDIFKVMKQTLPNSKKSPSKRRKPLNE
ncbi:MAG: alkaline phosphatase [Bacillota bacterium]